MNFDCDGVAVPFEDGQTIGAALVAAGRRWHTSGRGIFCGIGICFNCLVTVNGQPALRACLVPARPDDEVRS
jgi:aerobic-type carbon monoxide dehydrogenase small subunit (CoxS/CutS family)